MRTPVARILAVMDSTPQADFDHAYAQFAARLSNAESGHDDPPLPGMTPWSATKSSLREEGLDEDIIEAAELQLLSHLDLRITAELLIDRVALPHELAHGGVPTAQITQALRIPLAAMGAANYPAPYPDSEHGRARRAFIESLLDSALMHSGPGCIHPFDDAQLNTITDLCMTAWERLGLDVAELIDVIDERAHQRERDVSALDLD